MRPMCYSYYIYVSSYSYYIYVSSYCCCAPISRCVLILLQLTYCTCKNEYQAQAGEGG